MIDHSSNNEPSKFFVCDSLTITAEDQNWRAMCWLSNGSAEYLMDRYGGILDAEYITVN